MKNWITGKETAQEKLTGKGLYNTLKNEIKARCKCYARDISN